MKAVITVIGKDKIGIVYEVSKVLKEHRLNILDITQTIMEKYFTMIAIVESEEGEYDSEVVGKAFDALAEELGVSIHVQNEELFNQMHQI
ncbi:ACT domain-containing protein [Peptoniphilus sp. KCTC 25270]|uniref:ACT domain-containing protein n=1 Tax=Peptoniphilus sp. KCTC 25270 TaxID=2897414 RepID=UPI001E3FB2E7|nr:ACT domain-containing protein [Peptoniphilus sp. KCTC 25270]MCD1146613.1 ACT domain-containing protein [Peptoniphilus sp. KCTC 25270]